MCGNRRLVLFQQRHLGQWKILWFIHKCLNPEAVYRGLRGMEYKTGLLLALAVQFFGTGDGKCEISQNQNYSTSFIKLRGLIEMSPALVPSVPQHTDTNKVIKDKRFFFLNHTCISLTSC